MGVNIMENRKWVNYHTDKRKFLNKTTNKIYVKEEVKEIKSLFQTNLHIFYHENKIIGCMLSHCGYDRGPKRDTYIKALINTVKDIQKCNDQELFSLVVENANNKLKTLQTKIKENENE